jgi:hypothetical protein
VHQILRSAARPGPGDDRGGGEPPGVPTAGSWPRARAARLASAAALLAATWLAPAGAAAARPADRPPDAAAPVATPTAATGWPVTPPVSRGGVFSDSRDTAFEAALRS